MRHQCRRQHQRIRRNRPRPPHPAIKNAIKGTVLDVLPRISPHRRRRWRIVVNSMQAKAQPERGLEIAAAKGMSLGEGRLWLAPTT